MAEPKIKPAKRVAGRSKFRLPERTPRSADEINPLRELLQEARAQEEALSSRETPRPRIPALKNTEPSPVVKTTKGRQAAAASKQAATPAPRVMPVEPSHGPVHTYEDFYRRWSLILRSGQMGVCRALFQMTYEVGLTECFTSMPRLAEAAGLKERQCYNVVSQLELLGFIERPEIFNTPTQKGTVFRLNVEPRPPSDRAERRYHIGGEGKS